MNGHELIELIRQNGDLDKEVKVELENGKWADIKRVDSAIDRDPYDGDFDKAITLIELE